MFTILYLSIVALFFLVVLYYYTQRRKFTGPVKLYIKGPYNPDRGWIAPMDQYIGETGIMSGYDHINGLVEVTFADGQSFTFDPDEVIPC